MVNHRIVYILFLMVLPTTLLAQKLKTVVGDYTYYVPENVSLEQAKNIALERAKLQAIADAFGTLVTQTNSTHVENQNEKSDVDFLSVGGSEVKGEWIETIGKPAFKIFYEQNMLVVKVSVRGKAKELVSGGVDFNVHVLRNGTEDKFASDTFCSGDDLYLSFLSPASGYVLVYLLSSDKMVYCLLPYKSQQTGMFPVKANQRYVFFSTKEASEDILPVVDEYTITCNNSTEANMIYVLFSTNPFVKRTDTFISDSLPRAVSFTEFEKWLAKRKTEDSQVVVKMIPITIRK